MKGKGERGMGRQEGKEGAFPIEYSVAQQWLARKGNKNSLIQALMHLLHQMRTSVLLHVHWLSQDQHSHLKQQLLHLLTQYIIQSMAATGRYDLVTWTIIVGHLGPLQRLFLQRLWLALASPATANLFTEAYSVDSISKYQKASYIRQYTGFNFQFPLLSGIPRPKVGTRAISLKPLSSMLIAILISTQPLALCLLLENSVLLSASPQILIEISINVLRQLTYSCIQIINIYFHCKVRDF